MITCDQHSFPRDCVTISSLRGLLFPGACLKIIIRYNAMSIKKCRRVSDRGYEYLVIDLVRWTSLTTSGGLAQFGRKRNYGAASDASGQS